MAEVIITGRGTIIGRKDDLWIIDNGASNVYVAAANMLAADAKVGYGGFLTYEYRGFSRVGCFRAADDPVVRAAFKGTHQGKT